MHIIRHIVLLQVTFCILGIVFYFSTALPKPEKNITFSPLVIAHRGDVQNAPENSLAAIKEAKRRNAPAAEVDVFLSKDLVPVVIHDPIVDLTTMHSGNVKDFTMDELSQFLLINQNTQSLSNQTISDLESFIKLAKTLDIKLEIELKTEIHDHTAIARSIHKLFEAYNFYEQAFVSSFDPRILYHVRNEDPRITTSLSLLEHPPYPFFINYLFQQPFFIDYLGVSIIGPEKEIATDSFIEYWKNQNKQINVWTVNSEKQKNNFLNQGVSVTTDCIYGSC